MASERDSAAVRKPAATFVAAVVGPAFFLLAAWFLWGPDLLDLPDAASPPPPSPDLSTQPRRQMLSDPPILLIDGFERTCMSCHRFFPARELTADKLLRHAHIVLDHGINKRCRNCHDAEDRDRLILPGGETIGYDEVVLLCAKCHGPTFRDWQSGAHGRTNGYWDKRRGTPRLLQCTECHDPHNPRAPAMDPLVPLPGPRTLWLPESPTAAGADEGHVAEPLRDPLRRALQQAPVKEPHAPPGAGGTAADHDEEDSFE